MVFDWGLESFAKNVVSVAIAGAVIAGAGIGALLWAENRLKKKPPAMVQRVLVPKEQQKEEEEEEELSEEEN